MQHAWKKGSKRKVNLWNAYINERKELVTSTSFLYYVRVKLIVLLIMAPFVVLHLSFKTFERHGIVCHQKSGLRPRRMLLFVSKNSVRSRLSPIRMFLSTVFMMDERR